MSTVTYKVGNDEYSFLTNLQVEPYRDKEFALEVLLIEDIKHHKQTNKIPGIIHDVTLIDDNGLVAYAKNFCTNNVNLEIRSK